MERITITIETTNAAFGENNRERIAEASRILRTLANKLDNGKTPESLQDENGNTCGTVSYQ